MLSRPRLPEGLTSCVHTRSRSLCLGQRGQRKSVARMRVPLANLGKVELRCLYGLRDIAGTVGVVPSRTALGEVRPSRRAFLFRGCRSDSKSLMGACYP